MAWISPLINPVVKSVYWRLQRITRLKTESAEEFQKGESLPTGDRVATALFYLNDVRAGGSTVFPELGIEVKPIKGSVLLWRNLLDDGNGDYRTLHAACPIITGTKWVANLWFHEKGQQMQTPVA
ncbi:hypothetical protein CHUAL_003859 [Chamberlinius hualienensis]